MRISMPRGDIRPARFVIKSGSETVTDFDEIYLTAKTSFTNPAYLFQKRLTTGDITIVDGGFQFTIKPEDTNRLKYGKYVFDIEVVRGNDIKQTFIGELYITEESTFAQNEG